METLVQDTVGCARCLGDGHKELVFKPFTHPLMVCVKGDDGLLWSYEATHWAMCPTVDEPILLATINTKEDDMSDQEEQAAGQGPGQERENMEDTRPGEPGTVGDQLAETGDPGRDPEDPGPSEADAPAAETLEQPDDESGAEE